MKEESPKKLLRITKILIFSSLITFTKSSKFLTQNDRPSYQAKNCTDVRCKTCPKGPDICESCQKGHFLNGTICGDCIAGCIQCENNLSCITCSSTHKLTNAKKCSWKSWIWIAIGSGVVFIILASSYLVYVYDKKAVADDKKAKREKRKQEFIKKRMEEEKRKKQLEAAARNPIADSYRSIGGGETEKSKKSSDSESGSNNRKSSSYEWKSRVKTHGGKLTEYLTKIKLEKQKSMLDQKQRNSMFNTPLSQEEDNRRAHTEEWGNNFGSLESDKEDDSMKKNSILEAEEETEPILETEEEG